MVIQMPYSILETNYAFTTKLSLRTQTTSVSHNYYDTNIIIWNSAGYWLTNKTYCGKRYVI